MTIASRTFSKTKIIKSELKFKTHPIYKVKLIILSIKVTILGMAHFQCRFWAFSFDLSFNEEKNGSKIKLTQFKNYTSKYRIIFTFYFIFVVRENLLFLLKFHLFIFFLLCRFSVTAILFVQQIVANRDTIAIFYGNFLPSSLTLSGKAEGHSIYIRN